MKLFPAIDIKNGKCVRLKQGKFDAVKVYFEEPYMAAEYFAKEGAGFLHVVDLDGALKKEDKEISCNDKAVRDIILATNLPVQTGGGIRTLYDIEYKLKLGISRVIIGTKAVEDPEFVEAAVRNFGSEKIVVGIDAIDGKVATCGWKTVSGTDAASLALAMKEIGIKRVVYTDISKDGMLCGLNIEQTKKLVDITDMNIIASGGVSSMEDLDKAAAVNAEGAIIGKALYEGKIILHEAVRRFEH